RIVLRLTGARAPLVFRPLPCDDPVQRRPDIARARAVLGWSPAVGLETGLRATLDRFATEGLSPAPDACPVLPAIPAAPLDIGLALG
ncbi:hypothetical protein JMM59_22490, partial [Rhodovulum sulfidophilum]|nr:hypothetical protein [Rhodovulum sulfidophilum]